MIQRILAWPLHKNDIQIHKKALMDNINVNHTYKYPNLDFHKQTLYKSPLL